MTAALSADGWWAVATCLFVLGCMGLIAAGALWQRQSPTYRLGPDPRPPAVHVRRRPPYDWTHDGD